MSQTEVQLIKDAAVVTADIADQAVTLDKLPHGTGSNDGKFLRANNGADPSFETVTTTTINNNANNRIITGSGTANTLEAESGLLFTSTSNDHTLTLTGPQHAHLILTSTSGTDHCSIDFGDSDDNDIGEIRYTNSTNSMHFDTNANVQMTLDSSGNLGLGITPDAHDSSVKSLQIGTATNLYNVTADDHTILGNNVYFDGTANKRIKAQEAGRLMQHAGNFLFERAGADSADSAITFQTIIATNEDGTIFLKGQATSDNNRMQIRVDDTLATVMASSNSSTERNIAFHTKNTSGSLAGTFTANGLAMPSGKGIDFSATSDASGMTSELLDDYEEGTWTPTFNNAGGFSTNNTVAKYTKIGRVVHWVCQVAVTRDSSSSSGTFTISGLPFTALSGATGGHGYAGCMGALFNWNIPNTAYQIGIRVPDNTTFIQFFANFDDANDAQLTSPFTANKTVFGSLAGSYIT